MFDLECLLLATLIQCDECGGFKTINSSLSPCLCIEQWKHDPGPGSDGSPDFKEDSFKAGIYSVGA